jgi:rubrerythrin
MAQTIDFAKLTLKDALDLAVLIEEEAKIRYDEFARMVGGRYKGDSDEVFKNMAVYEAKHRDELKAKRQKLFGAAPVTMRIESLDDVEAPDRGTPRVFMSPRQAMEVALVSEEKAWTFFDDALRHVKDADVRKLFEELRAEEKQHQEYIKKAMATLPPGPDVEEDEADAPGSDGG